LLGDAIGLAEQHPVGTFRRALHKLIDTFRARTLTERHEAAVQGRRVAVQPGVDGMADLLLHIPAVEAHAIFSRATAIAKALKKVDGETRTLDQLRADVISDLLIEGDTTMHPEQARGIRASVVVTVPALSLLDDGHAAGQPATVEGVGPIPIRRARELCGGEGGWMRVLTHPETGMVLSVGRDRYDAPPGACQVFCVSGAVHGG
nr:13E12 repeat family protein [Myxococcota bacterium]